MQRVSEDVAAPPVPVQVDWAAVERWLGLRLPADYRRLADVWGHAELGGEIQLYVPCRAEQFDYAAWLREVHARCRQTLGSGDDESGLPEGEMRLWPDAGGLLAWGRTLAADVLLWDTSISDDPDTWTVVSWSPEAASRSGTWRAHGVPLAVFLGDALGNGVSVGRHRLVPAGSPMTVARNRFLPDVLPWSPPDAPERERREVRRTALHEGTGWDALRRLVPPPDKPVLGDGTASWASVFERLGARLPAEYVTLLEAYGSGTWCSVLEFEDPVRSGDDGIFHLIAFITENTAMAREEGDPDDFVPPVWPEPGGFLPFAITVGCDLVGWFTTDDDPDRWPLAVVPRELEDEQPGQSAGLLDTVLAWCRGDYADRAFWTQHDDDDRITVGAREEARLDKAEFTPDVYLR